MHGNTIEYAVIINFCQLDNFEKNHFMVINDKQQNCYLYNILDRFPYYQNMLVLMQPSVFDKVLWRTKWRRKVLIGPVVW